MSTKRHILVTDALVYANGSLHLGHISNYLQSDIWSRFQKSRGHVCHYICGSDTHGTPIMLRAEAQGLTPETMVKNTQQEHQRDFNDFYIIFDQYSSTNSDTNRQMVNAFYQAIKDHGDIVSKDIEQAFDEDKQMFLPDRYVKGTCPKCKTPDQYGDNCEACGATYSTTDLIDPISTVSGKPPIRKISQHFFFRLSRHQAALEQWLEQGQLQAPVVHKLKEWFKAGLQDWDISRDAPYFGFEIPDAPGKYFYVWFDAPIGYLSGFKDYAAQQKINSDEYWRPDSTAELHHFVGKDIMYFHALFWPAVLQSAGYRLPSKIQVHGYLTINGEKMSKSRGTFVTAQQYLKHCPAEHLRYYLAAKISSNIEDLDLNWEDFKFRVNADLVGKFVNIASRSAGFIKKLFDGQLADELLDTALYEEFVTAGDKIAQYYDQCEFAKAMRDIMALADKANQFIELHKPWDLAKQADTAQQVQLVCTQAINLFRVLMIYLKPVLPAVAENAEHFLNVKPLVWEDYSSPLLGHEIQKFKPLMNRITDEQLESLRDANTQ